jgi:hypothetical protein
MIGRNNAEHQDRGPDYSFLCAHTISDTSSADLSMSASSNPASDEENDMLIISLNRKIPLQHLNLMYLLDKELSESISTRYDDIVNMVYLTYGIRYDTNATQSILNMLKYERTSSALFTLENTRALINRYSNDNHFLTHASLNTIKPFTSICLSCKDPLKFQFKEKVNVFLSDAVENGVIYLARCCQTEYHSNSYIKDSKRFTTVHALHHQKYLHFGGKCVIGIDVLLRYASDLVNMVSTVSDGE